MKYKRLRFALLSVLVMLGAVSGAYAQTWVKTSPTELQTGDVVAIVDQTTVTAMSNDKGASAAPVATAVTLSGDKSEISGDVADNLQWEVTVEGGNYQFNVPGEENYVYCTNSNNGVRVGSNSNNAFTIYDNDGVDFLVNTATSRYIGVYNEQDWRCYTSINANIRNCVIAFYKKTSGGQEDTRTATTVEFLTQPTTSGTVGTTIQLPFVTVKAGDMELEGDIEWSSSDNTIATIEDNTISLLKVGTTTIKAEFPGDNNYKNSSASFTLTVMAAPYTTIGAMLQDITSTKTQAAYQFDNLLVTYVNGQYTFVSDGQNGFLFYGSDLGLVQGYTYSGTATGQLYTHNGLPEMSLTAEGLSVQMVTEGNEIAYPAIAPADLSSYINCPVTIEDAVFVSADNKNLTFKVGDEEFAVYNQWSIDVESLEADKAYTLKGIGSVYRDSYQLYLVSFEEYVESQPAEWTWRDFAVNLTDASIFATDVNSFGVKVAEDGSYAATAADDATANVTVNAVRFNDSQHGWVNCIFTMRVNGPVLIKLGDCRFGGQTGTITDVEGSVTEIKANASKDCWSPNAPDQNVVATYYRGLNPTTLTIKYDGYCPFISAQAVDPADLPAEVTKYTVTFDVANSGAEGVAPEAITIDEGEAITIPANFTLYKEGYTLSGWAYEGRIYAAGEQLTVDRDALLTATFTENEWNLGEQQEAVTVKFNFRRDQGAPTVAYQNQTGFWVAQATADGKTIDVKADFDTTNGKFANGNWTDWAQLNGGTKFTIPSAKGAVVSMEAFSDITTTTIDGQSDYTQGKVISYTVQSAAETVDVVIGDGSYYRYIQVVLPKVEKDVAGTSFDNVAGTISWQVGNEAAATVSDEIADAVQSALWSTGDEMTITTSTYFESTMVNYKPNNSNAGNVEGVMIEYRVKLAAGLTFKPTSVSYDCVKVGTDGATYSWGYVVDDEASTITDVDAATTLRNNGANSATAQLNHVLDMSNAGEGNAFAIRFYISKTANNKNICIGNVKINGVVNGTIQDVQMFTFAAAAAPAEAGSVNVYPAGESFEAGTELTLTATENFGYDFVNWTDATGTEVSTDAKFTYTVESDAVLTANFVAVNTYELALTVDGTNDYMVKISPAPTMVDGKMMYEAGQAVQLQADQYEGLVTFTNWSDGETNSSKLVSMDGSVSLTAYYAEADIIAGWDFYKAGGSGRKADFASADNEAAALNLVETTTGNTSGWLDKSTEAAGGYESFAGAATNWRTGAQNGDVGNWHWQTKLNAADFQDINVQFQMLYNYNAYQRYNAECSLDGENWTKFGDITMTGAKAPASFSRQLPAEANNQAELYIRLIADRTSNIDGTASANDGNTLAMFFITGTPKLVDDGTPPVLVSTVPENGATGASATGKIVLTFDERVKLTDNATATLGNQTLTPAVSGKTVTFEYKGLEYGTDYTFSLPANSIADLTDNYIQEAINLTFTTMVRPSVTKKLYDFIVPDDGTFAEALKAAAARTDKNVRYRIFVKQGDYVIAANQTALVDGNDGNKYADPKTYFNSPNVSIIGEDPANTSITNEMPNSLSSNPDAGANGQANPLEGIRTSGVLYLQGNATDTYFQDIKLWSATADATGRNVVLVDGGNRNIYKNVTLWAYQDTYVPDNSKGLTYYEGGIVRGRTDFICGSGDVFFNQVQLVMCQDGGYISVPRDNVKYGFVYKDCTIKGETSKVDGNYFLGRAWTAAAESYFINTIMEAVPRAEGWSDWNNGPTRFAEFNSMTASGTPIDLSSRKSQFASDGSVNNPVLTADEALEIGNLHNMFGDWDPTLATEQAPVPANVKLEGSVLTWTNSEYALLYAIVKDGKVVAFTTEPTYTVDDTDATWAVRAANEMGGLGEAAKADVTVGINEMTNEFNDVPERIYNINGIRVDKAAKGLYIVNGKKVVVK